MKKLISLILVLCMACMLIPAMAESAAATGIWYAKTMKMGDMEMDMASIGMAITVELNEDGTATMTASGQEPTPGTWTLEGDQITLIDETNTMTGTVTADTLTLELDGQTMILTREEPAAAIEPAAVKAAASAEEFYGNYVLSLLDMDGALLDVGAMGFTTGVSISADKIEIVPSSEEDTFAILIMLMDLSPAGFEDGALKLVSGTNPDNIQASAQLLEDGMIKVSSINTSNGEGLVFYVTPAAAAEEPAA